MKLKVKTPKDKGLAYGLLGLVGLAAMGSGPGPGPGINSVYQVGDRFQHYAMTFNGGLLTDYIPDYVLRILHVDTTYAPYAYRLQNETTQIISVIPGPEWENAVSSSWYGVHEWVKL